MTSWVECNTGSPATDLIASVSAWLPGSGQHRCERELQATSSQFAEARARARDRSRAIISFASIHLEAILWSPRTGRIQRVEIDVADQHN